MLLPPIVGCVAGNYDCIVGVVRGRRMSGNVDTLVLAVVALPMESVTTIGGGITGLLLAQALLSSNIRDEFTPNAIGNNKDGHQHLQIKIGIQL